MDTQDQKFASPTLANPGFAAPPNQGYGAQPHQPNVAPQIQFIAAPVSKRMLIRKQEKAFFGGGIIVATMGLSIAQSLYIYLFRTQWSFYRLTRGEALHAIISWNLAFIVGAALAVVGVRVVTKKCIYCIAACVLMASGALKLPDWRLADGPIASRYLAGFAQGAAFLTTIIHASEVVSQQIRGRSLGAINFLLTTLLLFGFVLVTLMAYDGDVGDFGAEQVLGILELLAGVVALAGTFFTYIESPVFLLEKNQSSNAIATLANLRYDHISSPNVANELTDLQEYINEGNNSGSLKALLRAIVVRSVYSVSTLILINEFAYAFSFYDMTQYGLLVFYFVRLISEAVSILIIDKVGRRVLLLISTGTSGVFALAVGCMFLSSIDVSDLSTFCALIMLYSLCVGIGIGTVSVTYLGESFSGRAKAFSIFLALLAEHAIQIIAMVILWNINSTGESFFIPIAVIQIVCCIAFYFFAPETKGLSLRQSRHALQ